MIKNNKKPTNTFKKNNVRVFKQFRKQKIFNQLFFVFWALVMAFWINSFVLNWDFWDNLKTNILEKNNTIKNSNTIEVKSDIYIEKENDITKIKVWKKIDNVTSLSFALVYNPEAVEIQDIISNIKEVKLLKLQNEKGTTTLILNFDEPQTIQAWKNLLDLYISKKVLKTTQHINIINSNFTDSTNSKYELTTSWITF